MVLKCVLMHISRNLMLHLSICIVTAVIYLGHVILCLHHLICFFPLPSLCLSFLSIAVCLFSALLLLYIPLVNYPAWLHSLPIIYGVCAPFKAVVFDGPYFLSIARLFLISVSFALLVAMGCWIYCCGSLSSR